MALIDCGGGEADRPFKRAIAFRQLGYRVAILRDDDIQPSKEQEAAFLKLGGTMFSWRTGRALEDELFQSLGVTAVGRLIEFAVELHGDELIDQHIKSMSKNSLELRAVRMEITTGTMSHDTRTALGRAARTKKAGWFKSVSWMEQVAREIAAAELPHAEAGFRDTVNRVLAWLQHG